MTLSHDIQTSLLEFNKMDDSSSSEWRYLLGMSAMDTRSLSTSPSMHSHSLGNSRISSQVYADEKLKKSRDNANNSEKTDAS